MTMDGWRQALTSLLEGIPQDVTPKAIRQVFNAGIKARQPVQAVRGYEIPVLLNTPAFLAAWGDYEQHRREKRKKLTPLAARNQLKALDAMGEARAIAAIHYSIGNGWTGIFEPQWPKANGSAKAIPVFKQIEIMKEARLHHPCCRQSKLFDPDASQAQKDEYQQITTKILALEQEQRKQVLG